jgi:hypothetical protein
LALDYQHFGGPFLFIQFAVLSHVLRQEDMRRQQQEKEVAGTASGSTSTTPPFYALALLGAVSIISQMSWQFTQLVMFLQSAAVFGTYIFGYLDLAATKRLFVVYFCIIVGNFFTQFGNGFIFYGFFSMLTFSVLVSFAIAPGILTGLNTGQTRQKLMLVPMQVAVVLSCFFGCMALKSLTIYAFGLELDDDHILNFVKSKFTGHFDFDTLQYECQAVFVGMSSFEYAWFNERRVTYIGGTAVLLIAIVIARDLLYSLVNTLPRLLQGKDDKKGKDGAMIEDDQGERRHPEFVCHAFLATAFFLMAAVLASRFKVLFIPHLSIVAAICFNQPFYTWLVRKLLQSPLPGQTSKKQAGASKGSGGTGLRLVAVSLYVASLGGAAYLVHENYDLFLDSMEGQYTGNSPVQYRSPCWRELVDYINTSGKVPEGSLWTGFMRTLGGLSLTSPTIRYENKREYTHMTF